MVFDEDSGLPWILAGIYQIQNVGSVQYDTFSGSYASHDKKLKYLNFFSTYFEIVSRYHSSPLQPMLGYAINPSTMCMRCVVTSNVIRGFSATMRSHEEQQTCVCCCWEGQSKQAWFRTNRVLIGWKKQMFVKRGHFSLVVLIFWWFLYSEICGSPIWDVSD